jgi:hypothetical protein
MIIKIIPETDEEIQRYKAKGISEVEHVGVREYMLFGNKIDSEGDLADFHEWHGAFRYLMGSLDYFYQFINDKRRGEASQSYVPKVAQTNFPNVSPSSFVKRGTMESKIQHIDVSNLQQEGAFEDEEQEAETPDLDIEAQIEQVKQELVEEFKPLQGLKILK